MQNESIAATIAALIAMAGEARRLAASLQRHQVAVQDHHDSAALHRIALVANDFARSIILAEAGLSDQVRAAINAN
jgi:hypothetical protein